MDANVQGLMGGAYLRFLFSCGNLGGLSCHPLILGCPGPHPLLLQSFLHRSIHQGHPHPRPSTKTRPQAKPHGNSAAICESINAAALENSGDNKVDDKEGYDYFGDMPNPDPEDNLPRDISAKFIYLFVLSRKCQKCI